MADSPAAPQPDAPEPPRSPAYGVARRRIPCPGCGYDLRGLAHPETGGTCPECGETWTAQRLAILHLPYEVAAASALVLGLVLIAACALMARLCVAQAPLAGVWTWPVTAALAVTWIAAFVEWFMTWISFRRPRRAFKPAAIAAWIIAALALTLFIVLAAVVLVAADAV